MRFGILKENQTRTWTRLDNAGKLFPCTTSKRDTNVFRFACELYEDVDPVLLQQALNQTMEHFPLYRSVLKKGLFWYYLESCDLSPEVREEDQPPCSPIYQPHLKSLLFRVTYYKKRINLEIFHSLSDGTGALNFLRMLVYKYLMAAHAEELNGEVESLDYDASPSQSMSDSFEKYYAGKKKPGKKNRRVKAYHIRGTPTQDDRLHVVEGVLATDTVLALARAHGTTVTVFLTALLLCKIRDGMPEIAKKRPVVVSIPVNLRNYFDSESSRNFFSVINIPYQFGDKSTELEDVIAGVKKAFAERITREALAESMNQYLSLEHKFYMRIVPLPLKVISLKLANLFFEQGVTAALSNVGQIRMPEQLRSYIHLFDVFFSTEKLQICMCSYGNNMTVSFSSPYADNDIQRNFFRTLSDMGVRVEIATNQMEAEKG